jgi:anti-sigma-K factor RskA
MTQDFDPADDDIEALAGEFFLGLLDAEGLDRVAALRERDDRFDLALAAWEGRLMPLATAIPPEPPPARLWAAIEAATQPAGRKSGGLWHNLRFWRGFGLGAGALGVAGLAAALWVMVLPRPQAPFATAMLESKNTGMFMATAQKSAGGVLLVVSPAQVDVPAGKSAELWLIMPGGKPQPLGLLAADHPVTMPLGAGETIAAATLAVSLEPYGGSPSGAVTGPVIAAAKFSLL